MAMTPLRARHPGVHLAVAFAGPLVVLAMYGIAMHFTVGVSRVDLGRSASHRDTVYLWIHLVVLGIAVLAGFLAGRWLNGLGLAYAALFGSVIAIGMVAVMLGSHELACQGHNDLVRHWTC
jgi:hypothetical protein